MNTRCLMLFLLLVLLTACLPVREFKVKVIDKFFTPAYTSTDIGISCGSDNICTTVLSSHYHSEVWMLYVLECDCRAGRDEQWIRVDESTYNQTIVGAKIQLTGRLKPCH